MSDFGRRMRRFRALEEDYELDIQRLRGVIREMRNSVDLLTLTMSEYDLLSDQNADPATDFDCFRDICCYRLEIGELYCTFLAVQPRAQAAFEALKEQEKKLRQAARSRKDQLWRSSTIDTCGPPCIQADVERIAERFRHYTDETHDIDIQAWAGNHKVPLATAVLRGQANFDKWADYGLAQFWNSVCANPSRFVKEYAGKLWPKATADWSIANGCSKRETSRSYETRKHRNEYETRIQRGFNKTGVETYEVKVTHRLSEDCSVKEPEYIYLEPRDSRGGSSKIEYEHQEPPSSRGRFDKPKVEYIEPRGTSSSRESRGFEEVEYEYIEPRAAYSSSRERESGRPEYEYKKPQQARSSSKHDNSREPGYEHRKPQKSRSGSGKPESSKHRDPKPSKKSSEVTTAMAEKWRSECEPLLKGEGSKIKSKFPEPPRYNCNRTGCNDRASSRAIPQCCEHGLEKLFRKMNGLDARRERVYWHPDRWCTAPVGKVIEYKAKASEVFVVLSKMVER